MAKGSIFRHLGSAALCAVLAAQSIPASAEETLPLQEAMQKEFKPWQIGGSWFGKVPDAPGVQPDGSIWWEGFSDSLIGKGLNKPRKWLTERCTAEQGALTQSLPVSTSHAPVTIIDPASHASLSVNGRMLLRWSWQMQRLPSIQPDDQSLEIPSADFGLFSCAGRNGAPLWHVAVGIAAHPRGGYLVAVNTSRANEMRLSLRIVDAKLVQDTGMLLAAEDRERQALRADLSERQQIADRSRQTFQSALALGAQTNCGMVIGLNGPLVEVQLPSGMSLHNGSTRVFVRRDQIDIPNGMRCKAE